MSNIKKAVFTNDNTKLDVEFDGNVLTWINNKNERHQVAVCAIVGVECGNTASESPFLTLHYLRNNNTEDPGKKYELNHNKLILKNADASLCQQWAELITSAIQSLEPQRPRHLLVFVNPVSGGGYGPLLFKKQVGPLFKLAGIDYQLIQTEHENHAKEVLSSFDLSTIDGIVVAGGDGAVLQITSALLHRQMADSVRDINDPNCEPVCTTLPIGIIPAGTGQFMVGAVNGTKCISTATYRIIQGHVIRGPINCVFNDSKLVNYANFTCTFGMFADMIYKSDQKRYLGRLRYAWEILKIFFCRIRDYEFELEFQPISGGPNQEATTMNKHEEQTVYKERLIALSAYNYGCTVPGKEALGTMEDWILFWRSGLLHINMMPQATNSNLGTFIKDLMIQRPDAFEKPWMKNFVCDRVLVRQPVDIDLASRLILDGETVSISNLPYEIRSHKEKILYFGIPVGEKYPTDGGKI